MNSLLLPGGVAQCFTKQALGREVLLSQELVICKEYEESRLADFCRGRYCAHTCLEQFGLNGAILKGGDGEPIWPEGLVGSISHTIGIAGAILTRKAQYESVGLDIERIGRIGVDLWPILFSEREIQTIRQYTGSKDTISTILFSIKEAFFKMQFPITKIGLEAHDLKVTLKDEVPRVLQLTEVIEEINMDKINVFFEVKDDLVFSCVLYQK